MLARSSLAASLLSQSPPALRPEILRRALSSQAGGKPYRTICLRTGSSLRHKWPQSRARQANWSYGERSQSNSATSAAVQAATAAAVQTPPAAPPPQANPTGPRRLRRFLLTSSLFLIFFSAGFAMSVAPAADTINGFVNPPTDAETLTLFQPATSTAEEVNEHIITHPLAVKLRAQGKFTESRPHLKMPEAMRHYNLTGGTLLGEDKIEVPPLTFSERSGAELPTLVQLSYLGPALCGHPGIVHGGLLATMLDEGLARCCFPALPNKVGVTANLKIDYRVPCPASSYVVLRARTTKVEGRKAWVEGWIELLGEDDGEATKLVEAEALFVEPKGAKNMARVYSSQ